MVGTSLRQWKGCCQGQAFSTNQLWPTNQLWSTYQRWWVEKQAHKAAFHRNWRHSWPSDSTSHVSGRRLGIMHSRDTRPLGVAHRTAAPTTAGAPRTRVDITTSTITSTTTSTITSTTISQPPTGHFPDSVAGTWRRPQSHAQASVRDIMFRRWCAWFAAGKYDASDARQEHTHGQWTSVLYLLVVYFLLKQVVSLSARGHTASAVLSLAHVRYPNSRGSADVVYFLLTGGVSLYAKGCTTSVVLSLAYV